MILLLDLLSAAANGRELFARTGPFRARQKVGDANEIVPIEFREEPHVRTGEVRAPAVDGVVHLAEQILVVLTRKAGDDLLSVTLARAAVTFSASRRVDRRATANEAAVAHIARTLARKLTHVSRNVRDRLGIGEQIPAGVVLHADVPPPLVAIVHELANDDGEVLARDPGHVTLLVAVSGGAVADSAVAKERCASLDVRTASHRLLVHAGGGIGRDRIP